MSGKLQFNTYSFGGGYNPTAFSTGVGNEQCTYGRNWTFNVSSERESVSIVKRPGASFIASSSTYGIGGKGASTDLVTHQSVYRQLDNTEWVISIVGDGSDGVVTAYNGTTTATIATAHADFQGTLSDSENYQNKLYIISNEGKYLEISYASPTWTINKLTPTGADSHNFKGTIIKEHEERMYIAGDPTYPYRLYISVVGDPTDFNGTGAGYLNFQSAITGIATAESYLVVHTKNHGIFKIYFDITGSPSRTHVPNSKGAVNHSVIAEIDNAQVYLADDGVYRLGYDANYPEDIRSSRISDDITVTLDGITNKSACSSLYFDSQYYLTFRNDADLTNTYNDHIIVYDFSLRAWTAPWEFGEGNLADKGMVGCDYIYSYGNVLYVGQKQLFNDGTNYISKAFKFTENLYRDTGYVGGSINEYDGIEMIYRTKSFYHDSIELLKYWYTTTTRYVQKNSGNPTVLVRADDKSNEYVERDLDNIVASTTVTLLPPYLGGAPLGLVPVGGLGTVDLYQTDYMDVRTGTPVAGTFAYIQFTHDEIDKSIELLSFGLEFRMKPRKARPRFKIY